MNIIVKVFFGQVIIWWAGLMRGAVSIALAYNKVCDGFFPNFVVFVDVLCRPETSTWWFVDEMLNASIMPCLLNYN